MTYFGKRKSQNEEYRETRRSSLEEQKTLREDGPVTSILMSNEAEVGSRFQSIADASAYMIEDTSLILLQVNCMSVYNKALELWNSVHAYNPDAVNHCLWKY